MPLRFSKLRLPQLNLPRAVYWFAALAFALRIVARLFYTGIADFWIFGYGFFFELAQSIAQGMGFTVGGPPTAFRVPLYPILLAGLTLGHQAFWPIAIAQSLIGAGTAICAALLACRLYDGQLGRRAAILAAAITALYPYYIIHDTALQETSFFTLLTFAAVLVLQQAARDGKLATGALAGLVLGLDVLTRPTIAPFAALAVVWLLWRRRALAGVACALLLAATVSPWILRNAVEVGEPTLSTETGIEFWAGNSGFLFTHFPAESSDVSKSEATNSLTAQDHAELDRIADDAAATDHWYMHKGLDYIRSHPRQTIVDGFHKITVGFGWLPAPRRGLAMDLVHAFSYGPVMVLGLWGMWRHRTHWREDSLIYLLFATFMLVTAIFWAQTSHRAYLDVYWIVFGAGVLSETVLAPRTNRSSALPQESTPSTRA
jgi:4-amino-4-deoxy-L-arabinose transferase-like glycosyltransferase